MPFGGLLTVGIIGAASSLGSSAIGAGSQKKAGALLDKRGQEVGGAIDQATAGAIKAGYDGMGQANAALDQGLSSANGTIQQGVADANGILRNGVADATGVQQGVYDSVSGTLKPYQAAGAGAIGSMAAGTADGGQFSKMPTMADLQIDPGFNFRLQQGQKALERSASARSSAMGGGTLKALARYSQGVASDEYGKAFDRFQTDRNARWGMLRDTAGFGERANGQGIAAGTNFANQVGGYNMTGAGLEGGNVMTGAGMISNNTMNTAGTKSNVAMNGNQFIGSIGLRGAESAGNARMGGALGAANGITGAGNAWANGVNNIAGSAQDMLLYKMLSQPTGGGIGAMDKVPGIIDDKWGG